MRTQQATIAFYDHFIVKLKDRKRNVEKKKKPYWTNRVNKGMLMQVISNRMCRCAIGRIVRALNSALHIIFVMAVRQWEYCRWASENPSKISKKNERNQRRNGKKKDEMRSDLFRETGINLILDESHFLNVSLASIWNCKRTKMHAKIRENE